MAQNQSLFPKFTLFRVWLAFTWDDAPMEVQVLRNNLDEHYNLFTAISFQEIRNGIRNLNYPGPAQVSIDHYPEWDITPRRRPCKIRVVYSLPEEY